MIERAQVYKCQLCGNIVEVLTVGGGELTCCGQPMTLMTEKAEDQGQEKHLPIIEKTADGVKVNVGSIDHPMTPEHYIEWIEVETVSGQLHRAYLTPDDTPAARFCLTEAVKQVRSYCNLHGLWKSTV